MHTLWVLLSHITVPRGLVLLMQTRGNRVFTGGPKTNPQPPATPAGWLFSCPEEVRMLHGVDVHARYQAGLQASTLAGVDFVITRVMHWLDNRWLT